MKIKFKARATFCFDHKNGSRQFNDQNMIYRSLNKPTETSQMKIK